MKRQLAATAGQELALEELLALPLAVPGLVASAVEQAGLVC